MSDDVPTMIPEVKTREQALAYVLLMLSNPIALMSLPSRAEALELSLEYNLTAAELIQFRVKRSERM